MSALMLWNVLVVVANTLLLLGLVGLYARMLRQVRTRFTLGLLLFAGILLLQNLVQLYFFATMQMYYAGGVEALVLIQNGLATVASAFLAFVTFAPEARAAKASAA